MMAKKKNPFKDFISGLPQLNNLHDPTVEQIDEALALWITKHYPNGFEFSYERRSLLIQMFRKSAEIVDLMMKSDFKPYLDASFDMMWKRCYRQLTEEARKKGKKELNINITTFLRGQMMATFILGYCMKSLEKKRR